MANAHLATLLDAVPTFTMTADEDDLDLILGDAATRRHSANLLTTGMSLLYRSVHSPPRQWVSFLFMLFA